MQSEKQKVGPTRRKQLRFPPFANCAKDGAPICIADAGKIKAWATRPAEPVQIRRGILRSSQLEDQLLETARLHLFGTESIPACSF